MYPEYVVSFRLEIRSAYTMSKWFTFDQPITYIKVHHNGGYPLMVEVAFFSTLFQITVNVLRKIHC